MPLLGIETELDSYAGKIPDRYNFNAVHEKVRASMPSKLVETPAKNSQHFKPQQPQTALKEKNTKSVKIFFVVFSFFQRVLEK